MNIKEQLKQYRALKLELEDINKQTQYVSIHDSVKGSKKDFPWTLGTKHVEGVPEEHYDLLARKSDIESQLRGIKSFVDTIEDNIVSKSLKLKYMTIEKDNHGKCKPPLKWFQVAQRIDCGLSGDGIRVKINRYLKNI